MEHAPWIGDRYAGGFEGQKLLLMGFSHYGTLDDGEDGPDLTDHVMRTWGLKREIPFFSTLASYFGTDDLADFYAKVAFANTLPTSVGDEDEKFAAGDDAATAAVPDRFRRLLAQLEPDKVIVFTAKGWNLLPAFDDRSEDGALAAPGRGPIPYGGYRRPGGLTLAYGLRHPMFAPWQMMRDSVAAILAARD